MDLYGLSKSAWAASGTMDCRPLWLLLNIAKKSLYLVLFKSFCGLPCDFSCFRADMESAPTGVVSVLLI